MTKRKEKEHLDEIIGRNIRFERETRRIRRDEFAAMINVASSHLGLIERGERGATPLNLTKISKILNVPVGQFFRSTNAVAEENDSAAAASSPQLMKLQALASCLPEEGVDLLVYLAKGIIAMNIAIEGKGTT